MSRSLIAAFKSMVCLTLLILYSTTIWAEEKKNKTFDNFTLYWENDLFAGNDRDYTNGFKLTWSTPYLTNQENLAFPDGVILSSTACPWSTIRHPPVPFPYLWARTSLHLKIRTQKNLS